MRAISACASSCSTSRENPIPHAANAVPTSCRALAHATVSCVRAPLALLLIAAPALARDLWFSVGQNTADHKSGAPTVTMASGLATFSVPQTAVNLGVGDALDYGQGQLVYLVTKVDTSHWHVVSHTGYAPLDAGA